jgi:GT2 family glycosyltransferase
MQMQNQLIGITVSYQYDDYLKHCLPNTQQLDYWYIVVDKNDTPTIELLKDIPNVIMVYFDFKEVLNNKVLKIKS